MLKLTVGGEYLTAKLSGSGRVKQVAIYARVPPTQKDYLERQLNALREWLRKLSEK